MMKTNFIAIITKYGGKTRKGENMAKEISAKKFRNTVLSLCFGFLMVVGAIIGVWAAASQGYNVGFNISYNVGENVAAKVRTEFYIPNSETSPNPVVVTTNQAGETVTGEDGYVSFGASQDTSEKRVHIGEFDLTPQTPTIEFYFTVYNMLGSGYLQVIVGEDYEKENINVTTNYCSSFHSFTELENT